MKIVIRADSGGQVGSGHVMRCLTLARELRATGGDVRFVSRRHPGHFGALIEEAGFPLAFLPQPDKTVGSSGSGPHTAHEWLGVSQQVDAEQTLETISGQGRPDWVIVDHYALGQRWEETVRPHVGRVLALDDLADRSHDCDVLLDPNLQLTPDRYSGRVPDRCRLLTGPKYAPLREEFRQTRTSLRSRSGRIERVLIFFGGGDLSDETSKALRALGLSNLGDLCLDVIIGAANPHQETIRKELARFPRARLHQQIQNMAELLAAADLAIGAAGSATWERCCLGAPTLALSLAPNQREVAEAAERAGICVFLGDAEKVSERQLARAIEDLANEPARLLGMQHKALALVDGHGARRVVAEMVSFDLLLRQAVRSDCDLVLDWRNEEGTRRFAFDPTPIGLQDHRRWFEKSLQDPDRAILIGEIKGCPVGVVRYDIKKGVATVSLYLAPGMRGRGFGSQLIRSGSAWLGAHRPEVSCIRAEIRPANEASIHAFSNAGFENRRVIMELETAR